MGQAQNLLFGSTWVLKVCGSTGYFEGSSTGFTQTLFVYNIFQGALPSHNHVKAQSCSADSGEFWRLISLLKLF